MKKKIKKFYNNLLLGILINNYVKNYKLTSILLKIIQKWLKNFYSQMKLKKFEIMEIFLLFLIRIYLKNYYILKIIS